MKPQIQTHSGKVIDFAEPEKSQYTIEDIAHGLMNTCRYSGQCNRFYSVGLHSFIVASLVEPEFELEALMHDATEAFMADIPTPLKILLPAYREIEKRMDLEIRRQHGIRETPSPEVKAADALALAIEKPVLMGKSTIAWELPDTSGIEPTRLEFIQNLIAGRGTMTMSKGIFISLYRDLKGLS